MSELKKTSLYDEHIELGGKMVDFAGWALPVQYEGLVPEHEAVRNEAGLFDVSHMGAVFVRGEEALDYLQYMVTNDVSKIEDNGILYTFMCYEDGGVVDDFLIYKYSDKEYFLVLNAANVDKDIEWMEKHAEGYDIEIVNDSDKTGILALQGPNSEKILQKLTDTDLSEMKTFTLIQEVEIAGKKAMVSRNGYTGEDGFEIYADKNDIVTIWREILEKGKDEGIKPAGLGSRDTLRFEAGLPLYGNELTAEINPIEAGQKFFVKFDKGDFLGKEALEKEVDGGQTRKAIGFELLERGIPREGYKLAKDGKEIGYVTTGYMSPTLGKSIGFGLVDIEEGKLGNEIEMIARKKPIKAKIVKRRFLANAGK